MPFGRYWRGSPLVFSVGVVQRRDLLALRPRQIPANRGRGTSAIHPTSLPECRPAPRLGHAGSNGSPSLEPTLMSSRAKDDGEERAEDIRPGCLDYLRVKVTRPSLVFFISYVGECAYA